MFWREGYYQVVLHDGWKLIVSERPKKNWLFNLAADPTERDEVATERPELVAQLQALLDEHNASQVEPLWPSVAETPVLIDKTGGLPYVAGDEYTYWPN